MTLKKTLIQGASIYALQTFSNKIIPLFNIVKTGLSVYSGIFGFTKFSIHMYSRRNDWQDL